MGIKDDDILKGVYLTLCSGLSETSQTLDTVSNIATVDVPGVIISQPTYTLGMILLVSYEYLLGHNNHIGVGSNVVCSTVSGNAKASESGTDSRLHPRFLYMSRLTTSITTNRPKPI